MVEPEKTRRVFFGLWPDDSVRAAIVKQFAQMPQYHAQATRMTPNNLHLTLHFIGHVDSVMLDCLQLAAQKVTADAFNLQLDCTGYFLPPKVFWLGCTQTSHALQLLHQQLSEVLHPCGYVAESRAFSPHVSLLRKLQEPGEQVAVEAIDWPVQSFALIESLPSSSGVLYRPLQNYFL